MRPYIFSIVILRSVYYTVCMPRVNVWIRKEDWEKWQVIPDKPEWLHTMITEGVVLRPMGEGKCQGHTMRMNCGRIGCKYA